MKWYVNLEAPSAGPPNARGTKMPVEARRGRGPKKKNGQYKAYWDAKAGADNIKMPDEAKPKFERTQTTHEADELFKNVLILPWVGGQKYTVRVCKWKVFGDRNSIALEEVETWRKIPYIFNWMTAAQKADFDALKGTLWGLFDKTFIEFEQQTEYIVNEEPATTSESLDQLVAGRATVANRYGLRLLFANSCSSDATDSVEIELPEMPTDAGGPAVYDEASKEWSFSTTIPDDVRRTFVATPRTTCTISLEVSADEWKAAKLKEAAEQDALAAKLERDYQTELAAHAVKEVEYDTAKAAWDVREADRLQRVAAGEHLAQEPPMGARPMGPSKRTKDTNVKAAKDKAKALRAEAQTDLGKRAQADATAKATAAQKTKEATAAEERAKKTAAWDPARQVATKSAKDLQKEATDAEGDVKGADEEWVVNDVDRTLRVTLTDKKLTVTVVKAEANARLLEYLKGDREGRLATVSFGCKRSIALAGLSVGANITISHGRFLDLFAAQDAKRQNTLARVFAHEIAHAMGFVDPNLGDKTKHPTWYGPEKGGVAAFPVGHCSHGAALKANKSAVIAEWFEPGSKPQIFVPQSPAETGVCIMLHRQSKGMDSAEFCPNCKKQMRLADLSKDKLNGWDKVK